MNECEHLVGRMRDICEGKTHHSPEEREAYLKLWSGQPAHEVRQSMDCAYRGDHIDWLDCPTCQGKTVRFKVFQCQLFARCVMRETVDKTHGCLGCESRAEPDAIDAA